ncbi:Hypothetical predicted protein [Paramuricea clavata]|uniref:Uncharacterized protein n=1 Tax=Paramuricea clavata TaxID=317549 RepID=A0A6S7JHN8_PARCT|nr:Hypothetical predicted protein [Paramuricea clavata]
MKRMRTAADSDSATSDSDVENSYNTDNEVETDSASESDSGNVGDTSSEVGEEYESDPWAPLKAEATQQKRQPYLIRAKPTALDLENYFSRVVQINWEQKRTKWNTKSAKNVDNTEINDGGSKERLKLETKTGQNS